MTRSNTPKRILATSQELFNQYGEPNVTTNRIADELDISPGNLHYHFRRKRDIVASLFSSYLKDMTTVLVEPGDRLLELEDMWWYLHLVFVTIGKYRFLYRDLNDILARYSSLQKPFKSLVEQQRTSIKSVCIGLIKSGILKIDKQELDTLVEHIVMTIIFWIPFSEIDRKHSDSGEDVLARAIYQVLSLTIPYLREPEHSLARKLARRYLY